MQVIRESATNTQTGDRPFYDFLEGCLRHKAEMVIFEAARAITELSGVTSRELTPAITVLQLFLSSSKPVLRFAAVRTLNKVYCFFFKLIQTTGCTSAVLMVGCNVVLRITCGRGLGVGCLCNFQVVGESYI